MSWRDHAACLGMDPELFFPSGLTGPALDQAERAKAVCRRCDVTAQCLEWALENGQDGIWGETTEDERRTLRRRRQRCRATN
ncbi:MAG: WhiB family transcriptional regulator [Egibacteraceae bacterium]